MNAPHIRKKAATVTATPRPMLSKLVNSKLIESIGWYFQTPSELLGWLRSLAGCPPAHRGRARPGARAQACHGSAPVLAIADRRGGGVNGLARRRIRRLHR